MHLKKNNFQHPCFRSSGESIGVCVWGLSRHDLSIVTPAGSWETFFYNIMSQAWCDERSLFGRAKALTHQYVLTTALIPQFAVVWSWYYEVFCLLPPPGLLLQYICVFVGFSPTAAFICSFWGVGGNKLFDWTHSGCSPLNDQQMETWLHLQARGFDHVITALGDRMSKSGWIPSLLVIQSWHYFCASHMFLWGCPAQEHFNRTSSIFILKVTAAKYHLSRWKRCKPPQPIVSDPGRIW